MTKEQQIKIQRCIDEFYSNRPQVRDELGAALQVLYEAEPVKHGRWIKLFETENDITARCSECRMVYTLGKGRDPNYCGTCGAKMDEDNTETLEAWDLDGSPTRYIRGQREDKAQDCGTCKNRKTCKDAPIPSCYACLGYEPTEAST